MLTKAKVSVNPNPDTTHLSPIFLSLQSLPLGLDMHSKGVTCKKRYVDLVRSESLHNDGISGLWSTKAFSWKVEDSAAGFQGFVDTVVILGNDSNIIL